ncbi:hypothetical protein NFF74_15485 [Proteus mirabilis]|uniref:hypothetical protein n=1 Tax=Morganellaceae TaxID=1903414 RepID=UPI00207CC3B3|nr:MULTISPECIES: hypothetical protein [Morganellaceae]MCJ5817459.1 hypothetical protein [Klebsiella pneumoniae]WBA57065.1 hypothetical protein O7C57_00110 [Providencia sp. 21OH12SH02B-Prov]MCO4182559.1 hypothetical protein [Proteus terrae]MCO4190100.1 hypothetical protein [Proteus terrae]MDF7278897.1 hypothetical protein [Proteus mirabilis]
MRKVNQENISGIKKIPMPNNMPTGRTCVEALVFGLPQFGQVGAESDISFEQSGQFIIGIGISFGLFSNY